MGDQIKASTRWMTATTWIVAGALLSLSPTEAFGGLNVRLLPNNSIVSALQQFTVELTVASPGCLFNGYEVTIS